MFLYIREAKHELQSIRSKRVFLKCQRASLRSEIGGVIRSLPQKVLEANGLSYKLFPTFTKSSSMRKPCARQ